MVLIRDIAARLTPLTELYDRLTQAQLLGYFDVATRFAPLINLSISPRQSNRVPPLPDNMALVLSIHVTLSLDDVFALWDALGDIILGAAPGELVVDPQNADRTLAGHAPVRDLGAWPCSSFQGRKNSTELIHHPCVVHRR